MTQGKLVTLITGVPSGTGKGFIFRPRSDRPSDRCVQSAAK